MAEKKSTEEKKVDNRARNFTVLLYPDSVNTPENWLQILGELQIPMFVSPLHDKDIDISGELKKPHHHIILMFEGKKSIEQVKDIVSIVGAVAPPEIPGKSSMIVSSIRGASRYLCHLDNPDKALYDVGQVYSFGGADYSSIISLAQDKYKALTEMEEFCEKYNVVSFFALARYASVHRTDWSRVLKDNGSVYMREYLQSRKWSIENGEASIYDKETGELII